MAYRSGDGLMRFTPRFLPSRILYWFCLTVIRIYDVLFFGIHIEGRENLKGISRGILVSNHTLIVDPGIIAHAIRPRRTYFTMLEETATIPFLGTFVRLLGGVPIPEGPAGLRLLCSAAREALRRPGFIHFFPEGEIYTWSQEVKPFHPGAFLIAHHLGLPVIPVTTVLHERRILGRGSFRILGRTIHVPPSVTMVIRPPILMETAGRARTAIIRAAGIARESIQAAIDSHRGSKTIFLGRMPRLVKKDQAFEPRSAA